MTPLRLAMLLAVLSAAAVPASALDGVNMVPLGEDDEVTFHNKYM